MLDTTTLPEGKMSARNGVTAADWLQHVLAGELLVVIVQRETLSVAVAISFVYLRERHAFRAPARGF